MASTVSLEGLKKAVFFPFNGKDWFSKMAIGAALGFGYFLIVPIIPLVGYFGRIMKRVIVDDEDPALPEWNDWGGLFLDGLKFIGISLIFILPAMIIIFVGYAVFMVMDFSMAFSVQGWSSSYGSPPTFLLYFVGMFVGLIIMWIGSFLSIFTAILLPPALGNMVARSNFGAAFHFSEWWPALKANFTGYLLVIALAAGLYTLLAVGVMVLYASVILCFLLPFAFGLILFILGSIVYSLYGVTYRDAVRKLAAGR
jgi:hypothetical protein